MRAAAIGFAVLLALGARARAQDRPTQVPVSSSSEAQHPDTDYAEPVRTEPVRIPATGFVMPDVPDAWSNDTSYNGRFFSVRLNLVPIVDYTYFVQDDESKNQVGEQKDQWDLRTFRIMFRGQVKTRHPITYFVSIEVKGKDHITNDGDSAFGFTDFEIGTPLGKFGSIKYGKIKEPFVYEMVGDAANLQQQERIVSPFFVSRGIGLRWTMPFAGDRMTASAGWFNDWWVEGIDFTPSDNNYAARLTGVPSWSEDGSNYVHLGISGRHVDADQGTLRFRGRPESNTASYYVDSGGVPADPARQLGPQLGAGRGAVVVSADDGKVWGDATDSRDPQFWGSYLRASYVLTGEHRPYDRKVGYARRVLPTGRWGAWEVFGRYGIVDLDDKEVRGGFMKKFFAGVNWWANRRWRVSVGYGRATLDKLGLTGHTNQYFTRVQWIY